VHLYGFSPVCSRVWFLNVDDCEKDFLQYLHWNGFSKVWMRMCDRRLLRELKPLLQSVHFNLPGTELALFSWVNLQTGSASVEEIKIGRVVNTYIIYVLSSGTYTNNCQIYFLLINLKKQSLRLNGVWGLISSVFGNIYAREYIINTYYKHKEHILIYSLRRVAWAVLCSGPILPLDKSDYVRKRV
jgi:hypothetical protein